MLKYLALTLLVLTPAFAAEDSHPIDKSLAKCMDGATSTADMVACEDKAFKEWDDELNRVYKELMSKLSAKQKEALKSSQLAWIKHKDAELQFVGALYDGFEGTMYQPMRVDAAKEVIKARAQQLQHWLDVLKEHGSEGETSEEGSRKK